MQVKKLAKNKLSGKLKTWMYTVGAGLKIKLLGSTHMAECSYQSEPTMGYTPCQCLETQYYSFLGWMCQEIRLLDTV